MLPIARLNLVHTIGVKSEYQAVVYKDDMGKQV